MIVTYKLLSGLYEQVTLQLDMATIGQHHTRGKCNSRKLTVMRCRFDLRKYCFTNRIVNMWNSLPDNVILADNVNQFKNCLDKHWKMHDIVIRTGTSCNRTYNAWWNGQPSGKCHSMTQSAVLCISVGITRSLTIYGKSQTGGSQSGERLGCLD